MFLCRWKFDLHAAGLDGQEVEAAAEQAPERLRGRVGRRLGTENSICFWPVGSGVFSIMMRCCSRMQICYVKSAKIIFECLKSAAGTMPGGSPSLSLALLHRFD